MDFIKIPEAIAEYDQYLRFKPDAADAYRYRGECYRLKDLAGARMDWQKAAELYQQKGETTAAF